MLRWAQRSPRRCVGEHRREEFGSVRDLWPKSAASEPRAANPPPAIKVQLGSATWFVIPSAVEESLIVNREIGRDVSTFARHDKTGGSSEESQRQNLRRKTRLRAITRPDRRHAKITHRTTILPELRPCADVFSRLAISRSRRACCPL